MTMEIMQDWDIGRFRVGELAAVPGGSNRTRRLGAHRGRSISIAGTCLDVVESLQRASDSLAF